MHAASCDLPGRDCLLTPPLPKLCRYGVAWRVASYFPGLSLLTLSFLNVLIHHTGSTGAIPLGAFFSLITFWFLISIPLCFSGPWCP